MIIGISGKARSGKDTLAAIAAKDGWKRLAFADELKRKVREDFGLTLEQIDGKLKEIPTQYQTGPMTIFDVDGFATESILYWTPREMMIEYGQFYRQFDKNYWVNIVLNKIRGLSSDENFMITDLRFPNEAEAVKNSGGAVIRLERHPSRDSMVSESIKQNISETALDDYKGFSCMLAAEDNCTPEDLRIFWNKLQAVMKIKL